MGVHKKSTNKTLTLILKEDTIYCKNMDYYAIQLKESNTIQTSFVN